MATYYFTEPFVTFDDIARVFDDAHAQTDPSTRHHRASHSGQRHGTRSKSFSPRVDVHDGPDNTIVASFELPGLTRDDVSIDLHNNVLTVSGEAKSTLNTEAGTPGAEVAYQVRERRFGKFSRSIAVPEGIEPESVKASVADGVLTVTFPKQNPEQAPKKIAVQ